MLTLAMDLSTRRANLALLRDGDTLSDNAWEQGRSHNQRFFDVLQSALADARIAAESIDFIAVGLGPGSFSGLRISVTAAHALALPARPVVAGVSSSKALAHDIMKERRVGSVAIVGDARRGRFWLARYVAGTDLASAPDAFLLLPPDEIPARVKDSSVVATPDWERIGAELARRLPDHPGILSGPVFPRALTVAALAQELAESRRGAGASIPLSPILSPIYLHPAVEKPPPSDR
jgi:tRNA threonylcarbamoyl adenosine modification protein YeaZ